MRNYPNSAPQTIRAVTTARAKERIAEAETATFKAETDVVQANLLLVVASSLAAVILATMLQVVAVHGGVPLSVAVCCFMVFTAYGCGLP